MTEPGHWRAGAGIRATAGAVADSASPRNRAGQERNDSVTAVARRRASPDGRERPLLVLLGSMDEPAPQAAERLVRFDRALVIGRRAPTVRLADETAWVLRDRLVSGEHARIAPAESGQGWELTDAGSTNGTVVDGLTVQPKVPLRDGSLIFLGGHIAVFRLATDAQFAAIEEELVAPLGPVPTCNPLFAVLCGKMRRLAETDEEVLLTGETGVGKEVYANAIHAASGRPGRFIAVNCAAIPRELVETELFGYVRGAHSQAAAPKLGIIEEAEGGTLFLDEIGDMAPELQTKLLRFTQDRLLLPVGGTRPRRLDVRILAATSRTAPPTSGSGDGGGLRADLAARLGAEPLRIPPLRDRIEDLGTLAGGLMNDRPRAFEQAAWQALALHAWPGNVRELKKVLTTADALSRDQERIGLEHLPRSIAAAPRRVRSSAMGRATRVPPTAVELEELIRRFQGNMLKVAREVDRKPALIYRWAKRFNIDIDSYRPNKKPTQE